MLFCDPAFSRAATSSAALGRNTRIMDGSPEVFGLAGSAGSEGAGGFVTAGVVGLTMLAAAGRNVPGGSLGLILAGDVTADVVCTAGGGSSAAAWVALGAVCVACRVGGGVNGRRSTGLGATGSASMGGFTPCGRP